MNGHMVKESNLVVGLVAEAAQVVESISNTTAAVILNHQFEREAYHALSAAQTNFEDALNAAVVEADYRASSLKEGPLAGLAKTSEVYKLAIKGIRAEMTSGELRGEHLALRELENRHRKLLIEYESAKTQLGSLQTIATLQAAMLRALSPN